MNAAQGFYATVLNKQTHIYFYSCSIPDPECVAPEHFHVFSYYKEPAMRPSAWQIPRKAASVHAILLLFYQLNVVEMFMYLLRLLYMVIHQ